jgi:hypothetical protein
MARLFIKESQVGVPKYTFDRKNKLPAKKISTMYLEWQNLGD